MIVSGNKRFLHIDNFLYYFQFKRKQSSCWQCRRKSECTSRAITFSRPKNSVILRKGPDKPTHGHHPSQDEVEDIKMEVCIKRRVIDCLEPPPARIMRLMNNAPSVVIETGLFEIIHGDLVIYYRLESRTLWCNITNLLIYCSL